MRLEERKFLQVLSEMQKDGLVQCRYAALIEKTLYMITEDKKFPLVCGRNAANLTVQEVMRISKMAWVRQRGFGLKAYTQLCELKDNLQCMMTREDGPDEVQPYNVQGLSKALLTEALLKHSLQAIQLKMVYDTADYERAAMDMPAICIKVVKKYYELLEEDEFFK